MLIQFCWDWLTKMQKLLTSSVVISLWKNALRTDVDLNLILIRLNATWERRADCQQEHVSSPSWGRRGWLPQLRIWWMPGWQLWGPRSGRTKSKQVLSNHDLKLASSMQYELMGILSGLNLAKDAFRSWHKEEQFWAGTLRSVHVYHQLVITSWNYDLIIKKQPWAHKQKYRFELI